MNRRNPRGTFGAISAGLILIAGPATSVRAALSYDISLGAGAQLNDNLHLDPRTSGEEGQRQPVNETIFTLDPGVVVSWDAERDRLQLNYSGEYSMFQGDEERDSFWVHSGAADFSWRRWSPFFLEARDVRSRVPRTQEREGEASVDQIDKNLLSVRTGLVSEMGSRSTVELSYRGELETYSGIEAADGGLQEFDRVERHLGEALVRHRWSPLLESDLRVSYGQVNRELTADSDELSVSAAVQQRLSEHLTLRYGLEWLRNAEDEQVTTGGASGESEAAVRTSLLKTAGISGDHAVVGSWNLDYRDGLENQPDGDTLRFGRASAATSIRARLGSTLSVGGWHETREYRESGREEAAWGPTLNVRWMIASWAALDLGGGWTSTTIRQESQADLEDRTTRGSAGLIVLLFKQVQLEAGYHYDENNSTGALRSYTNNLIYAQATFHFRSILWGMLPITAASQW